MDHTTLETASSTICDRSSKHKAKKKRNSSNPNSNPEDISLQKKSRFEGGSFQLPATDAYAQADAEVLRPRKKKNNKACSIHTHREAANAVSNNSISCASEDRKSDIVSQSLKTETAQSTICNQSQDQVVEKSKKSRKRKKSISDSGTDTCNEAAAEVSLPQRKVRDKSGSSRLDREAANGIVSKHTNVVSQDMETAQSNIRDQSKEQKVKKIRRRKKPKLISISISNADSNCDPEGISSQGRSCSGAAGGAHTQEDAEASQLQVKGNDKAGSSHLYREATNGIASDYSNNAVTWNIETAPSTICDKKKEHKAKKGKKQRKSKKNNDSITNVDSNCDPDGISSQKTSCFGGDLSLSSSVGTHTQADLQVSQLRLKENDKAGNYHLDQSKEHKEKKIKKRKKSKKNNDPISNADSNGDPDGISSLEIFSSDGPSFLDQSHVSSELSNVKLPSLAAKAAGQSSRKLLILDLNGLLADIRHVAVQGYKPDKWLAGRAVYKRPFCDDFLRFCFETFDVGVWSSRKWQAVECMSQFLMKNLRKKLLFSWDQSHCTRTRYQAIENKDKPIFLKELKKFWSKENAGHNWNWEKGFYNESNTLLIDDSPYKALRNPPYTGIFPISYECNNIEDNSLGPNGELRLYLKRLAAAENVQEFVKENPIGQSPITNSHPSWNFYAKMLGPNPNIGGQRKVLISVPMNVEEQKGGSITRPQTKEMKSVLGVSPEIQEDLFSQSKKRRRKRS